MVTLSVLNSGIRLEGLNRNVTSERRCFELDSNRAPQNTIPERCHYNILLCITYHYGDKVTNMRQGGHPIVMNIYIQIEGWQPPIRTPLSVL